MGPHQISLRNWSIPPLIHQITLYTLQFSYLLALSCHYLPTYLFSFFMFGDWPRIQDPIGTVNKRLTHP